MEYGKDYKIGDIVQYSDGYILRISDEGWCDRYISSSGRYVNSGGSAPDRSYKPATAEQKLQLEMSIQEKQLVPLERVREILKSQAIPTINNNYSII